MDKTPEPRHCQGLVASAGLIISYIALPVYSVFEPSRNFDLTFFLMLVIITIGRWRRIAEVDLSTSRLPQLAIGIRPRFLSCFGTAKRPNTTIFLFTNGSALVLNGLYFYVNISCFW